MRDRGDRRNVLHLERQRARRLGEHRARVGLEQLRDIRAEQRIVVGRLDAEALQHRVAEIARRPVDGVGDQQVIAGLAGSASSASEIAASPEGSSTVPAAPVSSVQATSSDLVVGVPLVP